MTQIRRIITELGYRKNFKGNNFTFSQLSNINIPELDINMPKWSKRLMSNFKEPLVTK